jgi:hypothetical protein
MKLNDLNWDLINMDEDNDDDSDDQYDDDSDDEDDDDNSDGCTDNGDLPFQTLGAAHVHLLCTSNELAPPLIDMLFSGDLYQIKPVGETSVYVANPSKPLDKKGRLIWNDINEFEELTENCRFRNDNTPIMGRFFSGARVGTINNDYLDIVNERVVLSPEAAKAQCHPDALWIANTHKEVNKINKADFDSKLADNIIHYRIISQFKTATDLEPNPSQTMKQQLYNKFNPKKPNYIDLAIGTRVLVPTNLATQIGIFNGTKGTVVGFGFTGTAPEDTLPYSKSFHLLSNREIPIVFVRMDIDIGYSVDKEKNVLPFTMRKDDGKILKKYYRWYMPLLPAQATTTHKAQGTTAHQGVVAFPTEGNIFARGLEYVMCTRQTMLDKLFLIRPLKHEHFQAKQKEKHQIDTEYSRLRTAFL